MRDYIDPATRARAVQAARGRASFDLLLTGGTVVDVGTGELRRADVGVVGSMIASVHPPGSRADAEETFDCTDRWLAPGLIDMHVHFESSMLTPGPYAAAVCPHGTTTLFCDPHELANVVGVDGVRYSVDASLGLPVRYLFQAPSCVPPQPGLELSGYDLHADEVATMLGWPEVAGLAEVMDMLGVLGADERMVGVVGAGLAAGKLVSGHAAGLAGPDLEAYLCAGIDSDHEVFGETDAGARLRAGMTVELRGAVPALLPGIVAELAGMGELPTHVVACTDDLFAMTLLEEGGVDHLLRRLIALGMPPQRALRIATYHAAYRLGRNDLGLVAAGRQADIIVLDSLDELSISDVFFGGRHVAAGGRMIVPVVEAPSSVPLDTMHLDPLDPDDFVLRVSGRERGSAVLRTIVGVAITEWGSTEVDVVDGRVVLPGAHILQAVVHRHGRAAPKLQLGLATGWGDADWTGAVASTVSHDTHNLVVFGRDPVAMAAAANAVIAAGGGVAVARGDHVIAQIDLPVAGILSPLPCEEVASKQKTVQDAALEVGLPFGSFTQPLLQVMASCLACLPGPHVTDMGLIDGTTGEIFPDLVPV